MEILEPTNLETIHPWWDRTKESWNLAFLELDNLGIFEPLNLATLGPRNFCGTLKKPWNLAILTPGNLVLFFVEP